MKIPEGWPTEEMIEAGYQALLGVERSYDRRDGTFMNAVFRAMLAAAPTPPAQEIGLPVDALNALRFYANGEHFSIDGDAQEFDTVSGEPDNWLHSQRDEDCTMIEDGSIARAVLQGKKIHGEVESHPVEGEVYGVAPSAQEGLKVEFTKDWCMKMAQLEGDQAIGAGLPAQDEPVAYIHIRRGSLIPIASLTDKGTLLKDGQALYTRPDNSGLHKAAERVIHCWRRENWTDGMPDLSTCLKWLNDALEEK